MSKKRNRRRYQTVRQTTAAPAVQQAPMEQDIPNNIWLNDGFFNELARLGSANMLQGASSYLRDGITGNKELLTTLYRENWIAKKIIDLPSEDMTRAWYTLETKLDAGKLKELSRLEARHNIKQELTDALRWARLYGGAIAVIVVRGHETLMDYPLDLSTVLPYCFAGLWVLDRHCVTPSYERVEDLDDPDYGLPKYYEIEDPNSDEPLLVHHSRVLRFIGRTLPVTEEQNEDGWGASELEHIYEELLKRDMTSSNISQLLFQANVKTYKMQGFGQFMAMSTPQAQQRVLTMVQRQNDLLSNYGTHVMDAQDSLETHQYTFSGISDVYEAFMLDMAGAAEIPATKLFGRAPQGMNATGESDMENYHQMIRQKQEAQLRNALERLLPVMFYSLWIDIPEDFEITFNPLSEESAKNKAAIASQLMTTISGALQAGLITKDIALKELRETGKPLGLWTQITDADVKTIQAQGNAVIGENAAGMPQGPHAPSAKQAAEDMTAEEFDERKVKRDAKGRFARSRGAKQSNTKQAKPSNTKQQAAKTNSFKNWSKAIARNLAKKFEERVQAREQKEGVKVKNDVEKSKAQNSIAKENVAAQQEQNLNPDTELESSGNENISQPLWRYHYGEEPTYITVKGISYRTYQIANAGRSDQSMSPPNSILEDFEAACGEFITTPGVAGWKDVKEWLNGLYIVRGKYSQEVQEVIEEYMENPAYKNTTLANVKLNKNDHEAIAAVNEHLLNFQKDLIRSTTPEDAWPIWCKTDILLNKDMFGSVIQNGILGEYHPSNGLPYLDEDAVIAAVTMLIERADGDKKSIRYGDEFVGKDGKPTSMKYVDDILYANCFGLIAIIARLVLDEDTYNRLANEKLLTNILNLTTGEIYNKLEKEGQIWDVTFDKDGRINMPTGKRFMTLFIENNSDLPGYDHVVFVIRDYPVEGEDTGIHMPGTGAGLQIEYDVKKYVENQYITRIDKKTRKKIIDTSTVKMGDQFYSLD